MVISFLYLLLTSIPIPSTVEAPQDKSKEQRIQS